MNQWTLIGHAMPLLTNNLSIPHQQHTDIIKFLQEEDVMNFILVYGALLEEVESQPGRAIQTARLALKSAIETLRRQVDDVYTEVDRRRNSVLRPLRGRAYVYDLRTSREQISRQLSLTHKRGNLLKEMLSLSQTLPPPQPHCVTTDVTDFDIVSATAVMDAE